jgi:hypothetical protein
MKIQLLFACVLAVNASGVAYAQRSQNCDVQVIFDCKSKCESVPGSAELTLDFDKKVGTFCRGEQCDDGDISFLDENEQAQRWEGIARPELRQNRRRRSCGIRHRL